MKLYLSSFLIGDTPDELVRLAGGRGAVTGCITNAGDQWPSTKADRDAGQILALRAIGLDAHEIDLREFFGAPQDLRAELINCQALWVRGGNTFVLRRAMLASGFDDVARPLIETNNLLYAGYSAGACVAAPTLRGIEMMDNPSFVPDGYAAEVPWDGMGLVDYSIAPHYRSDHPESDDTEKVVAYYEAHKVPYRRLRDGEVIVVETLCANLDLDTL